MSTVPLRYMLLARIPRTSTTNSQWKTEDKFDCSISFS